MAEPRELLSVMDSIVEPLVRADGGEVYVGEFSEQRIELHLKGRFSGCPGNTLAVRRVIEPAILAVAPACKVHVSAGELLPDGAVAWTARRSTDGA